MADRAPSFIAFCAAVAAACPAEVFAFGPSVHLRECDRVAARMIAEAHPLANAVTAAHAPWLRLGCIAPDLRQAVPELAGAPTHAAAFGAHLLKAAQQPAAPAGAVAFAVGALAHQTSDGAESVFAAVATAKALLGAPDVLADVEDGPRAECELLAEVLGEFPNGRADLLIALLQDLGVFSPAGVAAPLAWQPMLTWYHAQLVAFGAPPKANAAETIASLQALLASAAAKAAPLGVDTVQTMFALMKERSGAENLALLAALPIGDALAAVGMSGIDGAAALDPARFRHHARLPYFAEVAFLPTVYAGLAELGPHWALRRIAGVHVDGDFPGWNGALMAAAARLSLAHGMPAGTVVGQAAVLFDRLEWRTLPQGPAGALGPPIHAWLPGDGTVRLRVRLLAAVAGSVRVVLQARQAPPGFAIGPGALVSETSAVLDFDPANAEDVPRPWLAVDVDPGAAVGASHALYALLKVGPAGAPPSAATPIALGRLEPYAAHGILDVGAAPYHPWQETLPVGAGDAAVMPALALPPLAADSPLLSQGAALIRVVDAPAGNPLPGVRGRVFRDGAPFAVLEQSAPGRLLLDGVAPGTYVVVLEPKAAQSALALPADATASAVPTSVGVAGRTVVVTPGGRDVVSLPVWVLPWPTAATLELTPAGGSIALELAPLEPFGDQDKRLELRLRAAAGATIATWPLVALAQQAPASAAPPTPAALHYALKLTPAQLALVQTSAGLGPAPPLLLEARLCVWPKKASTPPPPTAFSPWRGVALTAAAQPQPPADAGASDYDAGASAVDGDAAPAEPTGDDGEAAGGDLAATTDAPAAAPPTRSAQSSPGACDAAGTAGGGWLCPALASLAWLSARRRRRRAGAG